MSTINLSPWPDGVSPRPLHPAAADVPVTFWQHPFAQNILPLVMSLMTHLAIVLIAVATYQVIKVEAIRNTVPQTDPGLGISDSQGMPQIPVRNVGLRDDGDPMRRAAQNKILDVKPPYGYSESLGKDLMSLLRGGGESDDISSKLIGVGAGRGFGNGKEYGSGSGNGGPLAPYGLPDGGIPGVDDHSIFKNPNPIGKTGRIVYICDATGSMMSEFDNLRVELRKSIEGLRPPQALNVVFFQENAAPPIEKNLLFATPSNKQRLYDFVDKYTPRGPTDPKPAIQLAFAMKPDPIFFLCDPTDFPDARGTIEMFKSLNATNCGGKCRVNTIDFMGDLSQKEGKEVLKQISADSRGTFSYVAEGDLGK